MLHAVTPGVLARRWGISKQAAHEYVRRHANEDRIVLVLSARGHYIVGALEDEAQRLTGLRHRRRRRSRDLSAR